VSRRRIVGALQHALEKHQAREPLSNPLIDDACTEMDQNCKAGDHFRVENGVCVWCLRVVS
jgi:hypothetical protein